MHVAGLSSLQDCWDRLLITVFSRTVPLADAEELVSDTLQKEIGSLDPER